MCDFEPDKERVLFFCGSGSGGVSGVIVEGMASLGMRSFRAKVTPVICVHTACEDSIEPAITFTPK